MPRFRLDRRAVLRGAGGTALALPFLEIMGEGKPRAATAPKRYIMAYAGISLTGDSLPTPHPHFWTPSKTGTGYDLSRDLAPLGNVPFSNPVRSFKAYGVQDQVSVVSGLKIPWGNVDKN